MSLKIVRSPIFLFWGMRKVNRWYRCKVFLFLLEKLSISLLFYGCFWTLKTRSVCDLLKKVLSQIWLSLKLSLAHATGIQLWKKFPLRTILLNNITELVLHHLWRNQVCRKACRPFLAYFRFQGADTLIWDCELASHSLLGLHKSQMVLIFNIIGGLSFIN